MGKEDELRQRLYKAACAFRDDMDKQPPNYDRTMRVAQELEDAADLWAER